MMSLFQREGGSPNSDVEWLIRHLSIQNLPFSGDENWFFSLLSTVQSSLVSIWNIFWWLFASIGDFWNFVFVIFISRNFFFNLWWLFKFKPLTNPSEVRFFFYYKNVWEICYQKYLVSSNFGPKFEKKWFSPIFFTKTKHFPHQFESYITSAFYWYIWQWNKPPNVLFFLREDL